MNIAIFGASGATGRFLIQRCLSDGHRVAALVRSPEPFTILIASPHRPGIDLERPDFRIIRGNAFDPAVVRRTIEGADVVLSALGARSPIRNENVLPRAVPLIVDAMQETGVRRIIVLGSAGVLSSALDKQPAWRRWIVENIINRTLLKWPVAEQVSQYAILSRSDLDWTMVMPPMLTNSPGHGTYRIDGEALPRGGSRISREDVADFMMQQLTSRQWIRKGVYLAW